jgi:MoxR-like ATPase
VDNLKPQAMPQLLQAGWALEQEVVEPTTVTAADLAALRFQLYRVNLSSVQEAYVEVVLKVRDLGIAFSDRRAVKVLKLLAASALLCGRSACFPSDLWVLRYVWDREEQIEPLAALINGVLQQHEEDSDRHPLAQVQAPPDGEELAQQLVRIEAEIGGKKLSLSAIARLRERLGEVSDKSAWLADARSRNHLLERARKCLERLG